MSRYILDATFMPHAEDVVDVCVNKSVSFTVRGAENAAKVHDILITAMLDLTDGMKALNACYDIINGVCHDWVLTDPSNHVWTCRRCRAWTANLREYRYEVCPAKDRRKTRDRRKSR